MSRSDQSQPAIQTLIERDRIKQENKRQRTMSESMNSLSRTATVDDESDEETTTASRAKKARAEVAQSARQAELREKENERERARADAAGRRQERAGRRRVDGKSAVDVTDGTALTAHSELDQDETPRPSGSAITSPLPSSQPPSPPTLAASEKIPQKKGPGKKTKKLGNNQYTKNRDLSNPAVISSPHGKKRQLANNQGLSSGDEQMPNGDPHPTNTSNSTTKNSPGHENGTGKGVGKFGKGKHKGVNGHGAQEPRDMSIAEMARTMDGMTTFMRRAQIESAGDRTPPGSDAPSRNTEGAALAIAGVVVQSPDAVAILPATEKPFEDMTAMEMADVVQRNIEKWKLKYGDLVV